MDRPLIEVDDLRSMSQAAIREYMRYSGEVRMAVWGNGGGHLFFIIIINNLCLYVFNVERCDLKMLCDVPWCDIIV